MLDGLFTVGLALGFAASGGWMLHFVVRHWRFDWPQFFLGSVAIAYLVVAVFGITKVALAQSGNHGDGHAQHHDVYRNLFNPQTGANCCNDQDCRPGTVWRELDGGLRARIGSQTVPVPESALLPDHMNPHPPLGMICERNGTFYCVSKSGAGI